MKRRGVPTYRVLSLLLLFSEFYLVYNEFTTIQINVVECAGLGRNEKCDVVKNIIKSSRCDICLL